MSNKKVTNRWLVVAGAVLVQLCLGAIYAWSVFTPYLKGTSFDGVTRFAFSATQTQAIFSAGLLTFALVMVFAGRWQDRSGPRPVAITGGIVFGIGYILARFLGASFWGQFACIGIIGGAGIGLAYVCPIAAGVKWFPDKKGLITGLAVAGFGFGALIWIKLASEWGHLIERFGVLNVFGIYGAVFLAAVVLGSMVLVNPPQGYKPAGWEPSKLAANAAAVKQDFSPLEMVRTHQFWFLWIMFTLLATAGLMVIGNIKLFGIDALQKSGLDKIHASAVAGTAMAVFYSLMNGLGRITWGSMSDKLGRTRSVFLMAILQGIMMFALFWMGGREWTLYIAAAWIGFNFGGNFALFPTATADFFGPRNLGINYALVFTSYGIAGVVGPILGGMVFDITKSYLWAFVPSAALCLVAGALAQVIHPPHRQDRQDTREDETIKTDKLPVLGTAGAAAK
jgi:OFA family oxalate/formate antiporter-like MFS transporter